MRKEVILAIIFGIILGGVVLYGINLANRSVSSSPTDANTQVTPTPTVEAQTLSIVSPQDHSVTTDKTVTLTGRAFPGSTLAVITESDDLIIEAGPEGTFSAEINLIAGENSISVTELKKDNTTISQLITVIQTNTLPE